MTTRFRLYVFTQRGCPACDFAKPHLEKFRKKHPEGMVIEVSTAKKIHGFKPSATPAYLLVIEDDPILSFEGALELPQLEDFLRSGIERAYEEDDEEEDDEEEDDEEEDDEEDE